MRILSIIILIPLALAGLPLTLIAVFLIIQAEVEASRFFASGYLFLYFTILCALKHLLSVEGRPMVWGSLSAVAAGCFLYASYSKAPRGTTEEDRPKFESVFLGDARYPVFHPANFVAEIDQLKTGYTLLRHFESMTSGGKGGNGRHIAEMKPDLIETYKELRYRAPELNDYGSSLHASYAAALGWNSDSLNHLYVYRPSTGGTDPTGYPVLLLLHGEFGNYKGNLWALKSVADQMGMAIVAPTHGLGNWATDEDSVTLERTLDYIRDREDLDSKSIVLVGLGEGVKGVTRFGRKFPTSFRGLIAIAGHVEENIVDTIEFLPHWRSRPVLIIHGSDDPQVAPSLIEAAVLPMKQGGINVTYSPIAEADQYLSWTHREEMTTAVTSWLNSNR